MCLRLSFNIWDMMAADDNRFRWAECQIQSIERLRDMSELRTTLADLPEDISETYVRIFATIPEADRPLLRRVLIWVIGHSTAPWMLQRGINVNVLLSAVTWDIYGPDACKRALALDCEELQELCGCLLTFKEDDVHDDSDDDDDEDIGSDGSTPDAGNSPSSGPNTVDNPMSVAERPAEDASKLFVSLAHYTVLEFLMSPHIADTPVSCFALDTPTVEIEFARSLLGQALAADPCGRGVDWVRDREAYCLTPGATLKLGYHLDDEARRLYLRYLCPTALHYVRFPRLQAELAKGREKSDTFCVNYIAGDWVSQGLRLGPLVRDRLARLES